jgi:hypothetical protein
MQNAGTAETLKDAEGRENYFLGDMIEEFRTIEKVKESAS